MQSVRGRFYSFQAKSLFKSKRERDNAVFGTGAVPLRPVPEFLDDIRLNFIHRRLSRNAFLLTAAQGNPITQPRILNNHPLSSAHSLLAYIRNYYQRGHIRLPKDFLSAVNQLISSDKSIYQSKRFQRPIINAYEEQKRALNSKLSNLEPLAKYDGKIREKVVNIKQQINLLDLTLQNVEKSVVQKNLFPQMNASGLNDNIAAKTIKGIYIRIAGPKPGTKADAKRTMAGAYSHRSDLINAEICNGQICTTLGTYGISIRIAYGPTSVLPTQQMKLKDDQDIEPFIIKNEKPVKYYE
jgi:hypothetical protein